MEYIEKTDRHCATLLQNSVEWDIHQISVDDDFGEAEFSWLADGIQRNKGVLKKLISTSLFCSKAKKPT